MVVDPAANTSWRIHPRFVNGIVLSGESFLGLTRRISALPAAGLASQRAVRNSAETGASATLRASGPEPHSSSARTVSG